MKAIAYCSPFVPAEWIAAHGLRPHWLRLDIVSGRPSLAVTRGICPYAGSLIDAALSGIDACALVLTTVCDQMRYAAAVIERRGSCPVFLMNVPSTWQTADVRKLYLDELRRLGRWLVQLGGKTPDNEELSLFMLVYDRMRLAVRAAHGSMSARQFAEAIAQTRDSATIPFDLESGATLAYGIPLAVLGGPLLKTDYALFDMIEQAGGRVALDATEGGERTLPRPFNPINITVKPLQELAAAYFDGIPDVFRRPNNGLYEWLGRELAARQVRGIIFRRYVWCDLWHAELHRLKQWSPAPVLEIDGDDANAPNRVQGRIEAFMEMLR